MTQELAALGCLLRAGKGQQQVAAFHDQWRHERLVINKWFGLQIGCAAPEAAVGVTRTLTQHPDFDWQNPNRFRAVFGSLTAHPAAFHQPDGSGYALLTDWLIRLDPLNPQTTARMVTAFETLKRYDAGRQAKMRTALDRIGAAPGCSRDTGEMVTRILGG